ncbi:MAG: 30S ribosomal protein S21 [Oligoflexus sp.]
MPGIRLRSDEPIEIVLKKFKKQIEKSGILSDVKKREAYEKPSIRRKRKAAAARKRSIKKMRKLGMD